MANTTNKFQCPRPSFKHLVGAEHLHKKLGENFERCRSAINYFEEDYMGKLLKVPDFINVNKRVK